jgi:4-amino-4-deoxy-L-arabinose transferase-like glycosyltransferase
MASTLEKPNHPLPNPLPEYRERGPEAPSIRTPLIASAIMLIGSIALIFTHLGHYALWDDEAITAMTARGVWNTGDTSVRVDDHNILGYRNGLLCTNFKDRYTPPLQFYLLAPVIGYFGESNFVCRLPFAICGLVTVAIMLGWLWRSRPPPLVWWSATVILLTNAEFFLFARQCRYYELATMLTLLVAYLYCHLDQRRRSVLWLGLALTALLTSQYLNYAAAVGCLIVDYAIWDRKRRRLSLGDWATLVLPQLIVGAVVLSIWNPLARLGSADAAATSATSTGILNTILPRLDLFWWNWRDMIASDFVIVPLLVMCPMLYLLKKQTALLRAPAALVIYLGVMTVIAPTPLTIAKNAEIRYLAPVVPLCVGIGIIAVWGMAAWKPRLIVIALGISLLSMVMVPVDSGTRPVFGSTALLYYHELLYPQQEPYTPTEAWINAHVAPGESIFVEPDYMCYPLMWKAGKAVYAWQFTDPPKPEFANLPGIQFKYRTAPDYMIAFGPWSKEIGQAQAALAPRGVRYELIDTIPVYWKDQFRPERIWHSFVTIEPKAGEEIYIYKRK